jgi:hypothetical protein
MKSSAQHLEQAAKYDALAAQATKERRRSEYARLAEVHRYLAEEAALLEEVGRSTTKKRE